ncbi:MAG: NAD(P)H-dependent flavin oxidoreductase [Myxococcota bacterium]
MLKTPLCDTLGIEHPVFLAGMGGVAYADVCAAVSEAGGFGTLGMAAAQPEEIRREMRAVRAQTQKPFGVDLLAALPETIDRASDILIEEGARVFIAGLGVPGPVVERFHRAGLQVWSMCGKVQHAIAAQDAGCDVVVAQGTEAGGHTGRVAGMALIPQIVDAVDIPVVAAGSIVDGRGLAAALAFGAQGVWMGTRFIASNEARAAGTYKKAILGAGSADTIVTRCYSGKPMRVIDNPYVRGWEKRSAELQPFPQQAARSHAEGVMNLTLDSYEELDPERMCMPAGQGSGGVEEILPAGEIVRRVVAEAEATISRMGRVVEPGSVVG